MSDYSKYERKFDWNLADLEHNKITIGEYEKQFRAIVDEIRTDAIDEYMNKLCDKCIQQPNECWNLECPFADDECQIIKIAEQLKENNES